MQSNHLCIFAGLISNNAYSIVAQQGFPVLALCNKSFARQRTATILCCTQTEAFNVFKSSLPEAFTNHKLGRDGGAETCFIVYLHFASLSTLQTGLPGEMVSSDCVSACVMASVGSNGQHEAQQKRHMSMRCVRLLWCPISGRNCEDSLCPCFLSVLHSLCVPFSRRYLYLS